MEIKQGVNYVGKRMVINAEHGGDFVGMTGTIVRVLNEHTVQWKPDRAVEGRRWPVHNSFWSTPARWVDLLSVTPVKNKLGNFPRKKAV